MTSPALPEKVDGDVLRTVLDGRWAHIRQRAREIGGPTLAPFDGTDTEAHRTQVLQKLRALAGAGLSGLGFPAAYGGQADIGGSLVAFEMLAAGDLSLMVKAGVQWGLFGGAVLNLGTERHHQAYLRDIIDLELLGCFAMTETGHGSDVASLGTTATFDPATDEFVINTPFEGARKDYIGNAARDGRMAAVFAQLITAEPGGAAASSRGVHAFLVPIRSADGAALAGVHISDCGLKGGLNGVDNGRLTFDQVRIPRENLLNRYGDVAADGSYHTPIENDARRFFTMLGTLIQGRVSVAGSAGTATKAALTIAVRYAEARRQFAAPGRAGEVVLLDYLAHQRRLLPAIAKSYALAFAQGELVESLHETFSAPELDDAATRLLEAQAAGLKAVGTWHATSTIQTCREACGGAGYLAENQLVSLKADTDVFATFEGDNTVLLQLVGKEQLTGYRDHFGQLDMIGTVRFVADQALESVIERTAVRRIVQRLLDAAPGRDEEADLLDRGWHVELFAWRERHLLDSLARRLRRAAGGGDGAPDAFEIFNAAQDHMLLAARAHVDRTLLDAFVTAIDGCADADARLLLERVCDLFVLSTVEAERAWFAEHGRLTSQRSKAVIAMVSTLCGSLRPFASTLVDGFGLPSSAITAPIALGAEARRQQEALVCTRSVG